MGSSVSVSNALSSNMLGSSSRMSNIYDIYIYIYIYIVLGNLIHTL